MALFDGFNKFFHLIKVVEKNNIIRVSGLDANIMATHLAKAFQTNKIVKEMFIEQSKVAFAFESFYAIDILYMLRELQNSPDCPWGTKRTCEKIIAAMYEKTWVKTTVGEVESIVDPTRLKLLKWKPMPKQMDFLHIYGDKIPRYGLRGYLLAAAPGVGKTFGNIIVATCVIPPSVAEVKIVISPKKAIHLVWEKTVRQVFVKPVKSWCFDSPGPMPLKDCEYYIFSYEALDKAIDLAQQLKARGIRYFITVDESHNFADPRSQRTIKLIQLHWVNPETYFLWLSGTPILKHAAELIAFFSCADKLFTLSVARSFKRIFTVAQGLANKIINHRLNGLNAFIVAAADVNPNKPIELRRPVKLPTSLSNKFLMTTVRQEMKDFIAERLKFYAGEMHKYRDIVNQCFDIHRKSLSTREEHRAFDKYITDVKILNKYPDAKLNELMAQCKTYERTHLYPSLPPLLRKEFKPALSAVKSIKLKVRGEALGKVLAKRRAECAAALALYCKPEEIMKESLSKTLFFASSVLPIQVLNDKLTKDGFDPIMVYGGTNSQLVKMMIDFEEKPSINPCCATMKSLSEAVPVTAASTVVFLNRPFREAIRSQCVARAWRNGQTKQVTVIDVVLDTGDEPNVSSTSDDILKAVRGFINELIGDEFSGPKEEDIGYQDAIDASIDIDDTTGDLLDAA